MNERDQEILNAPYKKIRAAEDLQESNYLLTVYRALYKNKFRNEPIFPLSNSHLTQIKDFRRLVGDQAQFVMEHYFTMKDDWFIKQQYSLDCLLKNINKVNGSYSSATRLTRSTNEISINWFCDSCWKPFVLTVSMQYDFDKLTRCNECTAENKPWKRVDRNTKARTLKTINSFVKDVETKKDECSAV